MKTIIKLSILSFLLLAGIKESSAHGEFTKTLKKVFAINPDAQVIIENSFGKVHCNNWDNNTVQIEITITVETGDEKSAGKIMDKISFNISGTPAQVSAKTIIAEGGFNGRNRVNIDYLVNLPASVNLDITNKFGDIYLNEVNGKGKINLSYGNLEANRLGNSDNYLDIKFSKANVKWMQGAVLNLKYSDFDLGYAGSLRLDSKYSNLDAEKIISLNVSAEGGKFDLGNSSAVESKSKFSDIDINRIEKSLSLDIQYGNCDIHEMPADFTSINIRNKYGNVDIGLADGANYSLDADLRFCDLDFPESDANITRKIITNTTKSFEGTVGKGSSPVSKVTIRSEFGNVSLE